MIWDWQFAARILPQLLQGLWVTIQAVFFGTLIAMVLGLAWAIFRRSGRALLAWPTSAVVEFIRSTPLLIQLYFVYYVLPNFGIVLPPWVAGIVTLGIYYSSYTSEVYRAGIEGIPEGQWFAARALNLTSYQTYRFVIVPQAIPPVVPALGNYVIAMFKDSPMLSAITVLEVLSRAKNIGNEHFRYLEPLTLVGLMYLVLSLMSGTLVSRLEHRMKHNRSD